LESKLDTTSTELQTVKTELSEVKRKLEESEERHNKRQCMADKERKEAEDYTFYLVQGCIVGTLHV
jgi:hypothetical protein